MGVSVFTPTYPGRLKKAQNDGNQCEYGEKRTSRRKFYVFLTFYSDFMYFLIFFGNFPIFHFFRTPQYFPINPLKGVAFQRPERHRKSNPTPKKGNREIPELIGPFKRPSKRD